VDLSRSKTPKFRTFGKKISAKNPLERFFNKIRRGRGSPRSATWRQNFTVVALEMWAEIRQNRQNVDFFVINLPVSGQSLKRF